MTSLWTPRRANCLIWALWMQWTHGGYVCWRKSWYGWWPHAIWSADRKVWYEYVPTVFAGRLAWWQILWIVLFKGEPLRIDRSVL